MFLTALVKQHRTLRRLGCYGRDKSRTLLFVAALSCFCLPVDNRPADANDIRVAGTELQVTRPDGSVITAPDLVGAIISFADSDGSVIPLRIDAVRPDPLAPDNGLLLYRFMQEDTASGLWQAFCPPTHDGLSAGFPLSGSWSPDGVHQPSPDRISLICANSAIGKCLRLGYRLWETTRDSEPPAPYHQTCTRVMRADYCGDGKSHTRDGTAIRIQDRFSLQQAAPSNEAVFEGLWGPAGALCLRRPRLARSNAFEDILATCPRLRGQLGSVCQADNMMSTPGALIRSYGVVTTGTH